MTPLNESRILNKILPLNNLLESRFGLRIELASVEHLVEVRAHYIEKRENFLRTMGEAGAIGCPGYAKAVLISEAINIILREIAPKRMKRKSKAKA